MLLLLSTCYYYYYFQWRVTKEEDFVIELETNLIGFDGIFI